VKEMMMMTKFRKILSILAFVLLGFSLTLLAKPVEAGEFSQASYQTPTPNADGQIIYTVREGDNCTIIYLLTGVPIDELIALNNLGQDCSVYESQQLILATVEPATSTPPGPQPTATLGAPTPTPFDGNGELCVVLFEDLDGNQMRSETEFYLGGGVVSVNNRAGTYSETLETVGGDPNIIEITCFQDVPEGQYNISMGVPDGYIATTSLNISLSVSAGDSVYVDFGAQPASTINVDDVEVETGGRSPILLLIGAVLLLGGAGLTFFFIRSRTNA